MIKATELRIGNWVWCRKLKMFIKISGVTQEGISVTAKNPLITFDFETLEGIPLSEEWFIKLGFEKTEKGYSIHPKEHNYNATYEVIECHYKGMADEGEFDYWIIKRDGDFFIDWNTPLGNVHELQNLYFALTGEELIIK